MMDSGHWAYSPNHGQLCRVIETQAIWGETTCRLWLPGKDTVVRAPASKLRPISEAGTGSANGIAYVSAASRVADALTQDALLAPIESSVIPLPHQINALSRAITGDRIRYLLADEVGLGKTIEAGLIMRELKLRGLVNRTLVVAPKGLVTQWVAEMRTHFAEDFRLLIPSDISVYRRVTQDENIWKSHNQIVCPMDSVKPMDSRRGWSKEQVADYNRERFEDLISAGWDLVIVDEAHRLGGSTEQVARYKLGQGLAEAAPYVLLLSATPHQGKTDAFHRLVALVDGEAFPDIESVTRERVQPYVIRTEKRRAIDSQGGPLFKPRRTQLVAVAWEEKHRKQHALYEAVSEYVREGYNQALKEKRSYIGFLLILMQRLVVSSTRAIRTTLERRLDALDAPPEQLSLFPSFSDDEWSDIDGQEQVDSLLKTRLMALKNERAEVQLLLKAARHCEEVSTDAKAETLLDWIYRLQQEESDPDLKVLIFTEFVPTQEMIFEFLTARGFSAVCLNGSLDMEERKRVQEEFAGKTRILISTDAGGEGLNLQFCHTVINFDIPWNPMRLEQRIGRVDRIGQGYKVRNTIDKEPKLWSQFWAEQGLSQNEVAYQRKVGEDSIGEVEETISQTKMRAVGLVVDKVDKIMHGMELGTPGMHNQVEQWGTQGFLGQLLNLLLEKRFEVSICSDHGNIEATGCGSPTEGAVADIRGQRARVYPDQTLRASVKEQFPEAIQWPTYGLPDDYLPLLAPGRKAFVKEGKKTVGHGGSALEELVVPLIHVERRDG